MSKKAKRPSPDRREKAARIVATYERGDPALAAILAEFFARDSFTFTCGLPARPFAEASSSIECNQFLDTGDCRHVRARIALLKYGIEI